MATLAIRASHRGWTNTTHMLGASRVCLAAFHNQIININQNILFVCLLNRIGNRRVKRSLDRRGRSLVRVRQNRQRVVDASSANQVDNQSRFLRRASCVSCNGNCFHIANPLSASLVPTSSLLLPSRSFHLSGL